MHYVFVGRLETQQAHHISNILTKERNKHWVSCRSRHGKLSPNYYVEQFLSSQPRYPSFCAVFALIALDVCGVQLVTCFFSHSTIKTQSVISMLIMEKEKMLTCVSNTLQAAQ